MTFMDINIFFFIFKMDKSFFILFIKQWIVKYLKLQLDNCKQHGIKSPGESSMMSECSASK